ncbi:MAG: type III-B CRISPR module RAMP protein Cmr6 [Bacteroidales bacterium]|nr:type III-B CRISPR module RAMP protein Cmr6 [Bacteroidales bacterium]
MGKRIYKEFSGLSNISNKNSNIKKKETGLIKWFDAKKGFGFFCEQGANPEVFIHHSNLPPNRNRYQVAERDEFKFDIEYAAKGPQAINAEFVKEGESQKKKKQPSPKTAKKTSEDDTSNNVKLPKDTRNALLKLGRDNIDNFYLKIHKTPWYDNKENKFCYFLKGKKEIINKIDFNFSDDVIDDVIKEIHNKHIKIANKLVFGSKPIPLSIDWRMIIGLGSASVYETGMTLHHIYGIPYIPGQAVKGVLRNYILNEKFSPNGEQAHAEERAENDPDFVKIFGSQKSAGHVIFFDAFPSTTPNIKPDVMTVHYKEYYSNGLPPGDYYNPNPIFFLTVEKTKFEFCIGVKKKHQEETVSIDKPNQSLLDFTGEYLKEALTEQGIGAKTAVGYGYFTKQSQ